MAHIDLPENLPGITGLLEKFPASARPLSHLAEVLLRGESALTTGERELIATYVSARNHCVFCMNSHGAVATALLSDAALVEQVNNNLQTAPISAKLKALLNVAARVQQGGQCVQEDDIAEAREWGASDSEIHDTVLIAAAFCMYNRYVDGLATWAPTDSSIYKELGKTLASHGYLR